MTQVRKIKRTYSLEEQTVETIERLAGESRRDLSAIIDIAIEEYAQLVKATKQKTGAMVTKHTTESIAA